MLRTMAPPDDVQQFVEALRGYVARVLGGGVALDGSPESLAFVDHYVAETAGAKLDEAVLRLVAPALGAYLGEVTIARFGGRWTLESADPATWRVDLDPVELRFYPVGMAAEALAREEVEGFDAGMQAKPELMSPLAEALAQSPPVDESYYYSLTGRYEVLEQAVDILVELERQRREDRN